MASAFDGLGMASCLPREEFTVDYLLAISGKAQEGDKEIFLL
jgi:hypothetical protein